jgi:hypothetical protein
MTIKITEEDLNLVKAYAEKGSAEERADAALVLPILQNHFSTVEALEQSTIDQINALDISNPMFKSAIQALLL